MRTLFVGNLAHTVDEARLRAAFRRFCPTNTRVVRDKGPLLRGCPAAPR